MSQRLSRLEVFSIGRPIPYRVPYTSLREAVQPDRGRGSLLRDFRSLQAGRNIVSTRPAYARARGVGLPAFVLSIDERNRGLQEAAFWRGCESGKRPAVSPVSSRKFHGTYLAYFPDYPENRMNAGSTWWAVLGSNQ